MKVANLNEADWTTGLQSKLYLLQDKTKKKTAKRQAFQTWA